jgi:hypothetical protein
MLWFLIIPVLWFFMFREMWNATEAYAMLTWPHSFVGWCGTAFGMFGCAFIGGLIAGGIASGLGSYVDKAKIWHLEDRRTEKLVAVRDKDGVNGAITGGLFLVAGYFESRPYYFYYTEDSTGAMRPDKINVSRSIFIHEIKEGDPRLVTRQWDNGRPWIDLFAITDGGWQYHFYVPEGTVKRGFGM